MIHPMLVALATVFGTLIALGYVRLIIVVLIAYFRGEF